MAEHEKALLENGVSEADVKAFLDSHPSVSNALHKAPHRYSGTAADTRRRGCAVHHPVARRTGGSRGRSRHDVGKKGRQHRSVGRFDAREKGRFGSARRPLAASRRHSDLARDASCSVSGRKTDGAPRRFIRRRGRIGRRQRFESTIIERSARPVIPLESRPRRCLHDLRAASKCVEALVDRWRLRKPLLGRSVSDWDVCTDARPNELLEIFPRAVATGIEHGTITSSSASATTKSPRFAGRGRTPMDGARTAFNSSTILHRTLLGVTSPSTLSLSIRSTGT